MAKNTRINVSNKYDVGEKVDGAYTVIACEYCAKKFGTKRPDKAKFCSDEHKEISRRQKDKEANKYFDRVIQAIKKNDSKLAKVYPQSRGSKRIKLDHSFNKNFSLLVYHLRNKYTDAYFFLDYGIKFFPDETAIIYHKLDCPIGDLFIDAPWSKF